MESVGNRTGRAPVGRIMTQEDVAERLNLSVRTIERWRFVGGGPDFVRLGRRVGYREEAVEIWLARNTFTSRAAELCSEVA